MLLGEIIRTLGTETIGRPANPLSLDEGGALAQAAAGYSIDSRRVGAGELFFAIRGEKHDGHAFVREALGRGALAAVVSRDFAATAEPQISDGGGVIIPVADTLAALQALAAAVLASWRGRTVAITGSMGKTTTKDLTARALAKIGRVIKTAGNLNNEYGLPLSVLKMESGGASAADFDFAVFEMGMNHKGEIARLARIAPPDIGVVTIVAPVHLEFFASLDEIADAKAELVAGIKTGGAAVLNADDARVARMSGIRSDLASRTFGIDQQADVMAHDVALDGFNGSRFILTAPGGEASVRVPAAGRHSIYNALAAAAVAGFCGAPLELIADAIEESTIPRMRGEVLRFSGGFAVIDDSYNSNPKALAEMAATLAASGGWRRRIIVVGEMLELGATAAALHREAGRAIASLGIDVLIGARGLAAEVVAGAREAGMAPAASLFCESVEDAAEVAARIIRPGDIMLVKGSRGVKTESVVERIKQEFGPVEEPSKARTQEVRGAARER